MTSRPFRYGAGSVATLVLFMGALSDARADSVAIIQLRTENRPRLDSASVGAVLNGVRQATSDTRAKYLAEWPANGSRPTGGTGSGILREAEKALRTATTLDYNGDYPGILSLAQPVLAAVAARPAEVCNTPAAREKLFLLEVLVVKALWRTQRIDEAERALLSVLRTYPDKTISRGLHGPGFYDWQAGVAKSLGEARGRLTVETEAGASVFVNERYVGRSPLSGDPMLPASYRIFVQQANRDSRIHEVNVTAGASVPVRISLELDAALDAGQTAPSTPIDLVVSSAEELERKGEQLTREVGRELGVDKVIALLLLDRDGRPYVEGFVMNLPTGKKGRYGGLALSTGAAPPTADQLVRLGRYLEGAREAGIVSAETVAARPLRAAAPALGPTATSRRAARIASWTLVAIGLGAAIAGAAILPWDDIGTCGDTERLCPQTYSTTTIGGALLGAGGALALAGSGLALGLGARRERLRTGGILALSWGVSAIVSGGLALAVQDYPLRFYDDAGQPTGKQTKPVLVPAAAVMGIGGALVATGIALLAVDGRRRTLSEKRAWMFAPSFGTNHVAGAFAINLD